MATNYIGTDLYGVLLRNKHRLTIEYMVLAQHDNLDMAVLDGKWQEIRATQVALEALEYVENG